MIPGGPPKKGKALLIIGKPAGPSDEPEPLDSPDEESSESESPSSHDANAKCETCYAFQPSTSRCQRFPPHGAEWSMVDPEDYCCEYKAGPQHDSQGGGVPTQPQEQPQGMPRGGYRQ